MPEVQYRFAPNMACLAVATHDELPDDHPLRKHPHVVVLVFDLAQPAQLQVHATATECRAWARSLELAAIQAEILLDQDPIDERRD